MIELLRDIFAEGGLIALIAVISVLTLAGLVYTVYMLVRQDTKDKDVVLIQAEVIAQFGTKLEAVANANAAASASLVQVAQLITSNSARMDGLRATLDGAILHMRDTTLQRTDQIEHLPGRIVQEMAPEFEKLPEAIKETLKPQIESLRQAIESLTQRIDDAADSIPSRSAEMTAQKLHAMIEETLNRAVAETVRLITQESPPPQGETLNEDETKPKEAE